MGAFFAIDGLQISFGRGKNAFQALSGLDLNIREGEILSLVGESGCGKSVTALSILGLLPRQGRISAGHILLDGRDLCAMSPAELDQVRGNDISMIFQDVMGSLNPVLTIGSQMIEGMRRHLGIPRAEAWAQGEALLSRVGIRDAAQVMRKYPFMLSGGMRQRAMIAMALSCKPRLLIADEPTTALDVTIQLQMMELLQSLNRETGMAILLITHDIGVVAELADRVMVMYAGQCVESGSVGQILRHPAHAYTRALIQSVPGIHDERSRVLASIPGSVPERYDQMSGCRFAPRCAYANLCPQKNDPSFRTVEEGHVSRCVWADARARGGEQT